MNRNHDQTQQPKQQPAQASTSRCLQQWQGPFLPRAEIYEQLQHGHGSRHVCITRDGAVSYCGHVDPSIEAIGDWIHAGRVEDYPNPKETHA